MARSLKFWIKEVEGLYYPCSENKGADQLRGYCKADLRLCFFAYAQKPVFLRRGSYHILTSAALSETDTVLGDTSVIATHVCSGGPNNHRSEVDTWHLSRWVHLEIEQELIRM